ncbi:MAG TPA: GGDEF and EAL domain-containing protein [Solirubrobacteraceae bacterium]|nr:GGDEF and EAL domain-containing protein [Solirubrobacteraceae bacterium]
MSHSRRQSGARGPGLLDPVGLPATIGLAIAVALFTVGDLSAATLVAAGSALGIAAWGSVTLLLIARLRTARAAAERDDLTGLLNRTALRKRIEALLRARAPFSVLLMDVDDLTRLNRRSGERTGDLVLVALCDRIRDAACGAHAIARPGNDEIVVVARAGQADAIAQRILVEFARAPVSGHRVTVSIGIADAPNHGRDASTLLRAAGDALRTAKGEGKARACRFSGTLPTSAERDELRRQVEGLCNPGRIAIEVQPIAPVDGGPVKLFESLARFGAAGGGSPARWLHAAEEVGLRVELELACLRAALRVWVTRPEGSSMSVNVSPDVLGRPDAIASFTALGDLHGLVLEITEEAIVEDYEALLETLAPLVAEGLQIAVDDVGAGQATMRHVVALRPAFLKLDRTLVRGVDHDPAHGALIDALQGYAQRVGALIVAEGVETQAELDALRALGIPLVQGYHVGRPASPWPEQGAAGRPRRRRAAARS